MVNTKRKYLSCAETAKLVRAALKRHFPGVEFRVRSHTYAGGASIDAHWIDGPKKREVEPVLDAFASSDFDGMIDLKTPREPTLHGDAEGNLTEIRYGADYVFANRSYSPELYGMTARRVCERFGVELPAVACRESERFKGAWVATGLREDPRVHGVEYLSTMVYRELEKRED